MSLTLHLDSRSAWAARLRLAGEETVLAPAEPDPLQDRLARIAEALPGPASWLPGAVPGWEQWELLLWNSILPLQNSAGQFKAAEKGLTHEDLACALSGILSRSTTTEDGVLRVNFGVPSVGESVLGGKSVRWRMETDYPRAGLLTLTLQLEEELEFDLFIRLPNPRFSLQLSRNGVGHPVEEVEGYLKLSGLWQDGDQVQFRFAVPFRVLAPGQKPVERAYPGYAPVIGGVIYHGTRALDARVLEGPTPVISVGVRKDGALMLLQEPQRPGSPFEAPGDAFLSHDEARRPVVARALAGSLATGSLSQPAEVHFAPFETAFDYGA